MQPKPLRSTKIVAELQRRGFVTVSQRGSHLKLRKTAHGKTWTAIVPMHRCDLAISVVSRILRQTGLTWDDLDL